MKLTQTDRKAIVAALQSEKITYEKLGSKYGISPSYIGQIYRKETGTLLRNLSHLSQSDKETIVAEIQEKKATMAALAKRYDVRQSRINAVFKEMTGSALYPHTTSGTEIQSVYQQKKTRKIQHVLQEIPYRAWHKEEKKMYPVLGVDWFNQKVLLLAEGAATTWHPIDRFILMEYSGLRDHKRTSEYPEGQKIYEGDIVQFSINLINGKKEKIKDAVVFDPSTGWFVVALCDSDPVAMYNEECEVIGTIYAQPELLGSEVQQIHDLLKK